MTYEPRGKPPAAGAAAAPAPAPPPGPGRAARTARASALRAVVDELAFAVSDKLSLVTRLEEERARLRTRVSVLVLCQRLLQERGRHRRRLAPALRAAAGAAAAAHARAAAEDEAHASQIAAALAGPGAAEQAAALAERTAALPHLRPGVELSALEDYEEGSLRSFLGLSPGDLLAAADAAQLETEEALSELEGPDQGADGPAAAAADGDGAETNSASDGAAARPGAAGRARGRGGGGGGGSERQGRGGAAAAARRAQAEARLARVGRGIMAQHSASATFCWQHAALGGAPEGAAGAGGLERPQAFWDHAMCSLGLTREQADLLIDCHTLLEQRLQRLHGERKALCDELGALTGGAAATAGAGAAVAEEAAAAAAAEAEAEEGGAGARQEARRQQRQQQETQQTQQQNQLHHHHQQPQQQHQHQQHHQQQQQAPEQPASLPPPLGFESFLAQSEIADSLMANTDAMGSLIRLHTCLGFGVLTDAQRARLWARCFPAAVNAQKCARALERLLRVRPAQFPPAGLVDLRSQMARWAGGGGGLQGGGGGGGGGGRGGGGEGGGWAAAGARDRMDVS
ncbi:hypothetical protein Rsub_05566 [Raphidocelis subcapitata]|uniref:Uncharacterized protein n=1 Tax=Raphidocelis subcapitata TaxID=307507 RepID=A0A2V0NXK9_9CHLO|nr:hypothetical protein Rsub_05566 [Raphidocelis subcapitata]|eukprot:GBF92364.1 hypothetical protein Rsub_05566 [Raphidocelis subcapitata]